MNYEKGDRVQLSDEWLQHPVRRRRRNDLTAEAVGTVVAVHRSGDLTIVWDGDSRKRRTLWSDFWIQPAAGGAGNQLIPATGGGNPDVKSRETQE